MSNSVTTARDIPKTIVGTNGSAISARGGTAQGKSHSLPTPPNSISPSKSPYGLDFYGSRSITARQTHKLTESDLNLEDDNVNQQSKVSEKCNHETGLSCNDSTGAITSNLLSRNHLPEILLNHGPLAIRHIMSILTTAVPGFSKIPPTKARRLVVSALEEGANSGGVYKECSDDVKYEKLGWGRWSARLNDSHSTVNESNKPIEKQSLDSHSAFSYKTTVDSSREWKYDRTRLTAPDSGWEDDTLMFSNDKDFAINAEMPMTENDSDQMSIDMEGFCSSPEESEDDEIMSDNSADTTDDEDWAAVGAAALRAASYSTSGPGTHFFSPPGDREKPCRGGGPSSFVLAKSCPRPSLSLSHLQVSHFTTNPAPQERDAIEALLQLGSL
ncbi:BgTH12-02838 [Blumeria graminis f. sp. triticale]|uniref:BgTH12-02838 n=1 Tax=Blumeria graminis f. sp. triticale TaxID=1689686 RepID=A0A9W4D203_BLUGR|nr:BgTH12-02838 [Blumeria graminis f. sp. triticale]